MAFDSLPISIFAKAPQHLLFALPEPDQTAFLPHHIQEAGDGVVLDLDVISQLPGRDFLEVNPPIGLVSGSISV